MTVLRADGDVMTGDQRLISSQFSADGCRTPGQFGGDRPYRNTLSIPDGNGISFITG
jgi:hypothetical protein